MIDYEGKEGLKQVNNSLKHLLVSLSALQLKWLIRIILKDLKIGVGESLIFESFHPYLGCHKIVACVKFLFLGSQALVQNNILNFLNLYPYLYHQVKIL